MNDAWHEPKRCEPASRLASPRETQPNLSTVLTSVPYPVQAHS